MKCIVPGESGRARVVEIDPPRIGPGELLLDLRACGLCGTDLAKIRKPRPGDRLGHELVGVVRESQSARFRPGDRVVVGHHVPCGRCRECLHDSPSMCGQFKTSNIDPCGFSEQIRVPALNCDRTTLTLPEGVSDEAGTFVEPLACGLRAIQRSRVREGDRVGIYGAGTMGLLIGQAASARGAAVSAVDVDPARSKLAQSLGLDASEPSDLDAAILTAVVPQTLEAAIRSLRPGGSINLFAGPSCDAALPVDLDDLYHRELTILSTYSSTPEDLRDALELIRSGRVRVEPLVSMRLPLSRFEVGIKAQGEGRALKVIFVHRIAVA
jgi:L-iditol 2-dehydrogenase